MGVPYIDSGVPDIRDLPNVTLHNTKVNTLETIGTISGGDVTVRSLTSSGAITGTATNVTSLTLTDVNDAGLIDFKHDFADNYPGGIRAMARIKTRLGGSTNGRGGQMEFHTKVDGGTLVERLRINDDGNVGIGITTPTAKLQVNGTISGGDVTVTSLTSSGAITGTATNVTSLSTEIFGGPEQYGPIRGGQTTVTSLECSGAITAEGLTAGPVTVDSLTTVDGSITTGGINTGLIHAPTTGSDLFLRLKGGHASAAELHVGAYDIYYRGSKHFFYGRAGGLMHSNSQWGGIFFNGNVFWSSDNRLKHNEEDITDALGTIRKLNAQKYQKTDEPKEADFNGELTDYYIEETGFIAQDVMEIPELAYCVTEGVTAEGKDIYNLKYTDIFVVNVQAVKELDAIVQSQQTEIDSLKARLTALENKN
jgi:hypothetical protein